MAVNFDDGTINHGALQIGSIAECFEDLVKAVGLDSASIALEHTVPVAKFCGQITPWATGTDNPQDGFNEQAVICYIASGIGGFAAAQWLYFCPLGIGEGVSDRVWIAKVKYECQQTLAQLHISLYSVLSFR